MKRFLFLLTLLFGVLLTLSACSKVPVNNVQNSANPQQNNGSPRSRMPDFGQPDRPADIRGVVKSITGNEAVILKVDMRAGRGGQNVSSTPGNDSASGNSQAPAVSLSGAGGERRAFGGGGPGGQGGQGGTTERAAMLERIKAMSTGEETITIPVGIQMLKASSDATAKQPVMVEATLSDIVSDKSITIWLASSTTDKKVAEFILIN